MRKRQDQDAPVPLVELLEAAAVETPGALVDALSGRGDAVVVDALGRLAAPLPVAEGLWAEQEERERIAMEEAEKAEEERLARLREFEERREEERLARLKQQALRDRVHRVEQASGLALWQLEAAVTRSKTHESDRGMSYDQRAAMEEQPVGLDAVERFVAETFGISLEGGDK